MTTTISTAKRGKPPATAPAEDAHAAAERAGDAFIGAVRAAIARLPEPSSDLNAAAEALIEAWRKIDADPKPTLTAASATIAAYWTAPRGVVDVEVRRTDALTYLPAVLAAVDTALAGAAFTRRGELDRAQAEVAALEAEQRRLLTALEEAVSTGDVDQVLHCARSSK